MSCRNVFYWCLVQNSRNHTVEKSIEGVVMARVIEYKDVKKCIRDVKMGRGWCHRRECCCERRKEVKRKKEGRPKSTGVPSEKKKRFR